MDSGFFSQLRSLLTSRPIWIGAVLGVAITILAILIRPLTLFRYANDPLQLVQPIIQLRFGLINFNWRLPLIHLGFVGVISAFSPLLLKSLWAKGMSEENSVLVARSAALISIAYMWWLRVYAISVVIWYGIATWVSVALISWLTRKITIIFLPKGMRIK